MSIMTPAQFMQASEAVSADHMVALANNARIRAQFNQRHGTMPDSFVVPATCDYIEKLTSINLTLEQLQDILALYPAEKARIARFTSSDFAHCELVKSGTAVKETYLIANMVAHFFGRTTWPKAVDAVDFKAFIKKLQRSAMILGYSVAGCTSVKLSA